MNHFVFAISKYFRRNAATELSVIATVACRGAGTATTVACVAVATKTAIVAVVRITVWNVVVTQAIVPSVVSHAANVATIARDVMDAAMRFAKVVAMDAVKIVNVGIANRAHCTHFIETAVMVFPSHVATISFLQLLVIGSHVMKMHSSICFIIFSMIQFENNFFKLFKIKIPKHPL